MPTTPELDVTFYDRMQPSATAGVYTVEVTHELTKDGREVDADAPLSAVTDRYEIRAAQFVLDPATVHATYPPTGATGRYGSTLPHITLSRAVLPWERQLQGVLADARQPWLALLVFAAGEVDDDPDARGEGTWRTVGELIDAAPDRGILGPGLTVVPDREAECRTIDVPAGVFTAVVPREHELFHLAHLRDVRTAPRLTADGEVLTEGEYAVIAANRFPRAAGDHAVHLVSLEGWLGRLGPDGLPTGTRTVRLCSLWSWHFANDPDGSLNPAALLRGLTGPGREDPEALALRLTPTPATEAADPAEEHARQRLHHGYTAVAYRPPSGESTFAWYRGPFTPLTAPALPAPAAPGPHTTADHALIYDPDNGLFDVGYAAAWTLGRTIALADPDYTGEVTEARRALANRAAVLSALGADPARALHDPDALPARAALARLAERGLGTRLTRAVRERTVPGPPPAPAARTARVDTAGLLTEPRARASLTAAVAARTPTLPAWLDHLALLRGVPFHHLVPDPRMLPPESLRAFRIDPAWIGALVAGATDVGALTSTDQELDTVLRGHLATRSDTPPPVAGLLMRSELVRAWPVFEIIATHGADRSPAVELRRDHLAPDLLLVLWDAVPDALTIREPGQGLHFGIDDRARISLRHPDGPEVGWPSDRTFPDPADPDVFQAHLRSRPGGALPDVLRLQDDEDGTGLATALADFLDLAELTPGQLALQLVNAPLEHRLLPDPTAEEQA
ncbi:hypothetical protein [Kitasatospora sp. NPDC094011]|uniref:hypothetical protein n=1 Tax=Kitasatospora sp. NPDC094011 TaxID=3364090 RepID=UPI0037FEA1AA